MRTYEVVKRNKRLHIVERDEIVYTPPNFVKLPSRDPLKALALTFTRLQSRDIGEIAAFETMWTAKPGFIRPI